MKKQCFTLLLLVMTTLTFAQKNQTPTIEEPSKNEFKINVSNFIIFKYLDVGYERILNEESTIGINILTNTDSKNNSDFDYYRTFSVTPYYRHFFGKKYAQGFFVEGFGMLHSRRSDGYYETSGLFIDDGKKITDVAFGVSTGAKFITNRGFVAEVYLGIGRNLTNTVDYDNIVGRGGISLGWRF